MKSFIVMLVVLLAGDLALFRGAYSVKGLHAVHGHLKSIQSYADDATGSLTRA